VPSQRNLLVLLPILAAAGCLFDYQNPAEQLRAGEASGAVVADRNATGSLAGFPGVSVSLKGAAYDQTTRETGRFALLDLPVGRHTLLFRKGTTWSLERDVEIAFGKDGQPEGVDLGRVVLRYSAAVEGRFDLPAGLNLASGVAVDETTGQTAVLVGGGPSNPNQSTYRFPALDVGTHLLKVAARDDLGGTWVGGQAVVTIADADQGTTKVVAPIPPHASAATGRLRFRVQVVGNLGVPVSSIGVFISPDPDLLSPIAPDTQGYVDVTVPEGLYQVLLVPGAGTPRVVHASVQAATAVGAPLAPPAAFGVVILGKVAEVGSVYLVSDLAVQGSIRECVTAADCGGLTCAARQCLDYQPKPGAGATLPFCTACSYSAAGNNTCAAAPGLGGGCTPAGFCDPGCQGVVCTTDGSSTLGFPPGICP